MIVSPVLEFVGGPQLKMPGRLAEEKQRQVEHVRAEIAQRAEATVAPRRAFHVHGGAVAVEHPTEIELSKFVERLLHSDEVRLEPMIVGCVAGHAIFAGEI